jgi:hypothetical protein
MKNPLDVATMAGLDQVLKKKDVGPESRAFGRSYDNLIVFTLILRAAPGGLV